jgi:hypothetical protein
MAVTGQYPSENRAFPLEDQSPVHPRKDDRLDSPVQESRYICKLG